ncbi:MAG TPA: hypothetical protein VN836_10010 [Verrucomicrobiae bacterium]|nr:hypothetical protein [Verrucomicrobiae bacterium]
MKFIKEILPTTLALAKLAFTAGAQSYLWSRIIHLSASHAEE